MNTPTEESPTPSQKPFHTNKVAALAAVHFIHDIYTSFLSPILPLLIKRLELSLTQAGSLTVFMQLPSLFNPFLGAFADKKRLIRLFVVITPGVTAILLCFMGLAPNYATLIVLLLAAGMSVAALHISAPVLVARHAGDQIGRGMGFFMLGGELARTTGPLVAVWAASTLGLENLWMLAPAGVLSSVYLWWRLDDVKPENERQATSLTAMFISMRRILTAVIGILIARSFLAVATTTFLPTYLNREGLSLWWAGAALALVQLAGAIGVYTFGTLSDRLGRRTILWATASTAPFFLFALLYVEGWLMVPVLFLLGLSTIATGPVLMATVIENAGGNTAAANGTFMAISFAIRSSVVLVVGMLSDAYGMRVAYTFCAFVAFLGLPFILWIPKKGCTKSI